MKYLPLVLLLLVGCSDAPSKPAPVDLPSITILAAGDPITLAWDARPVSELIHHYNVYQVQPNASRKLFWAPVGQVSGTTWSGTKVAGMNIFAVTSFTTWGMESPKTILITP